jgi:hypothetical protein
VCGSERVVIDISESHNAETTMLNNNLEEGGAYFAQHVEHAFIWLSLGLDPRHLDMTPCRENII